MGPGQTLIYPGVRGGGVRPHEKRTKSLESQGYVRNGLECPTLFEAWVVADLHAAYLGSKEVASRASFILAILCIICNRSVRTFPDLGRKNKHFIIFIYSKLSYTT